jgi:ribosomal protein S27AE
MTSHPRPCPRCKTAPGRAEQTYCAPCQIEYVREWRKTHQRKDGSYGKTGAIAVARRATRCPELCECGSAQVRATHPDTTRPLFIRWACEQCAAPSQKRASA